MRDTLAAASGLSQAIVATASVAPDAIRTEVQMLASRLSNGMSIPEATRMFADEVADPSCDLVAWHSSWPPQHEHNDLWISSERLRTRCVKRLRCA